MRHIIHFELKYFFKRPAIYIFWILMFGLGLWLTIFLGSNVGGQQLFFNNDGKVLINSEYTLFRIILYASYFGVIILVPVFGSGIYRDFENNTYTLIFTSRIKKVQLLLGKFISSYIIALIIFSGIIIGSFLGGLLPIIITDRLGDLALLNYLKPFVIIVPPNLLIIGVLFFSLTALTRKVIVTYTASVILVVLLTISQKLLVNPNNMALASIIDSFGNTAFKITTQYWAISEKNFSSIPLNSFLLRNRLIWLSIGILIFIVSLKKFRYSYFNREKPVHKKVKKAQRNKLIKNNSYKKGNSFLSKFRLPNNISLFLYLTRAESSNILKNIYFQVILLVGVIMMFVSLPSIGFSYGTLTLPVTYKVTETITVMFELFFYIIIIAYSGEVIWRERKYKLDGIIDSSPVQSHIILLSKLSSLTYIIFLSSVILVAIGITFQFVNGFVRFDFTNYFVEIFVITFTRYTFILVLAFFIHSLVNNKYFGFIIMGVFYILDKLLYDLFPEYTLIHFASHPKVVYSEMNGYAHFLNSIIWHIIYWASFCIILVAITIKIWVRGLEGSLRYRLRNLKRKLSLGIRITSTLGIIIFLLSGTFIYYNTHILNDFETGKIIEEQKVRYEKEYRKFNRLEQPNITDVYLKTDFYPKERKVSFNGCYFLKNKSKKGIDTVIIELDNDAIIHEVSFESGFEQIKNDKELGFYIYVLKNKLLSGDSVKLEFNIEYKTKGFKSYAYNTDIVENGSMLLSSNYLPVIGYSGNKELKRSSLRKKYGLKTYHEFAERDSINNTKGLFDFVKYECIISTTEGQQAFTSGELINAWQEEGRSYSHFISNGRIISYFPFISGKYETKKGKYGSVSFSIFYHKGHDYNVGRMMKSVKYSLEYSIKNYGEFPYRELRIVEFPRYFDAGISLPNIIPFSEATGFVARVEDNTIDYPSRILAHEVAHAYWGHIVNGAKVKGMPLLLEPLAQYTSLMIMKGLYGEELVNKYVKYELIDYLKRRAFESKYESPLIDVEHQTYLWYEKGTIVMNSLSNYWGESYLNNTLKGFYLESLDSKKPRTSLELVDKLYSEMPDSLKYLINDLFEEITLFDNKILDASYQKSGDKYIVNINLELNKYYADSIGNIKGTGLNDYIKLSFYNHKNVAIHSEMHLFNNKNSRVKIVLGQAPEYVCIDPQYLLIDRDVSNNKKYFVENNNVNSYLK